MTKKAFTLVELLVVITILSIISVVAYQSFGGATDKAKGARKLTDVTTIETGLQMYKVAKQIYPPTAKKTPTNLWGFDSTKTATKSNKIKVTYTNQEISAIDELDILGGGYITMVDGTQIGAKGTITQEIMGKKYLTKDLYDPELGEKNVGSKKMIDFGIGRYVYATYKKGGGNMGGNAYNIAYTVKKDESDDYVTKIVGDYDEKSCYGDAIKCPPSLIGPGGSSREALKNNDTHIISPKIDTFADNQGIPYPVADFTVK